MTLNELHSRLIDEWKRLVSEIPQVVDAEVTPSFDILTWTTSSVTKEILYQIYSKEAELQQQFPGVRMDFHVTED